MNETQAGGVPIPELRSGVQAAGFRIVSWRTFLYTFLLIIGINVAQILYKAVYNLYFHPLRKLPGPKLWIAFPVLRNVAQMRGQLDFQIRELHETYGDVVRMGANFVSFTSPEAWKDIYGHGHAELPKFFPKGTGIEDEPKIISANARDHFRFRRAMLPAFSDKALGQQEPLIMVYVDLLVEKLRDVAQKGELADMVKWYTLTTFDL